MIVTRRMSSSDTEDVDVPPTKQKTTSSGESADQTTQKSPIVVSDSLDETTDEEAPEIAHDRYLTARKRGRDTLSSPKEVPRKIARKSHEGSEQLG